MNIHIEETTFPEVKLIHQFRADDNRGTFVKTFHHDFFAQQGIEFTLKESFYSISTKDVIRGLHFHAPPYDHAKIIFCTQGTILDVAVDLRKDSIHFGKFVSCELSFENNKALYIPKGFAHGFLALTETATTCYFVDGVYNQQADGGVRYDSLDIPWNVETPIVSARDLAFEKFENFNSPF